jgi:serine beta-lactamase-like protein LACTB
MKYLKIAAALIVTGLLVVGFYILWIGSGLIPVPDLGKTTVIDRKVYNPVYSASIEKAQARLVDARSRLVAPALSLALGIDGELVWAEAHGFADIPTMDPVKITTRFPIGSVSKSITAVAVSQLVEKGALNLDADIHTYVPDYPTQEYEITTRQLLSHQAGIRHYNLSLIPPVLSEAGLNRQ